jgi:hypothetical protein
MISHTVGPYKIWISSNHISHTTDHHGSAAVPSTWLVPRRTNLLIVKCEQGSFNCYLSKILTDQSTSQTKSVVCSWVVVERGKMVRKCSETVHFPFYWHTQKSTGHAKLRTLLSTKQVGLYTKIHVSKLAFAELQASQLAARQTGYASCCRGAWLTNSHPQSKTLETLVRRMKGTHQWCSGPVVWITEWREWVLCGWLGNRQTYSCTILWNLVFSLFWPQRPENSIGMNVDGHSANTQSNANEICRSG